MPLGTIKERLKEGEKKPTRFYSAKQEKTVAKAVKGVQTPNSGATPWAPGDVVTHGSNGFLIECKTKTSHSESISIKKEWIEKNKKEAIFRGKPFTALSFSFGPSEENYYIIDEWLFKELVDHLKNS